MSEIHDVLWFFLWVASDDIHLDELFLHSNGMTRDEKRNNTLGHRCVQLRR